MYLNSKREITVLDSHRTLRFVIAPKIAQTKKTREGENRSAIDRMANTKVPEIKFSCTAEVICPTKFELIERLEPISLITALHYSQTIMMYSRIERTL